MSKKEIIQVVKKDKNISTTTILEKIYQALDPNKGDQNIEAVEFPYGTSSDQINIKLSAEANKNFAKDQLEKISEITLKK
jgi:hypothetical protein